MLSNILTAATSKYVLSFAIYLLIVYKKNITINCLCQFFFINKCIYFVTGAVERLNFSQLNACVPKVDFIYHKINVFKRGMGGELLRRGGELLRRDGIIMF